MVGKIHPIAGVIGFAMILILWTSTVASELFGTHETIAMVKGLILNGMFILVPSMAIVGATGMSSRQRTAFIIRIVGRNIVQTSIKSV